MALSPALIFGVGGAFVVLLFILILLAHRQRSKERSQMEEWESQQNPFEEEEYNYVQPGLPPEPQQAAPTQQPAPEQPAEWVAPEPEPEPEPEPPQEWAAPEPATAEPPAVAPDLAYEATAMAQALEPEPEPKPGDIGRAPTAQAGPEQWISEPEPQHMPDLAPEPPPPAPAEPETWSAPESQLPGAPPAAEPMASAEPVAPILQPSALSMPDDLPEEEEAEEEATLIQAVEEVPPVAAVAPPAPEPAPTPGPIARVPSKEDIEWEAREAEAKALIEEEAALAMRQRIPQAPDEDDDTVASPSAQELARRAVAAVDAQEEEEAERRAQEEAQQRAKEAAQQRAKEEAQRRAKEEAQRRAKEEAQRLAKEAAAQRAKKEAQQQAHEEARARAQAEIKRRAQEEALRKAEAEIQQKRAEARSAPEEEDDDEEETTNVMSPAPSPFEGERKALDGAERLARAEAERIAVTLAAKRKVQTPSAATAPVKPPQPAADGSLTTVLLVDDSSTMRRAFRMVFDWAGFAVETVASGDEALDAVRSIKPDIVVADLTLDDKDGYEICREIRADPELAELPVILLHGPGAELDQARAQEVGASGDVAKPFDTQVLIDKVCEITGATPF